MEWTRAQQLARKCYCDQPGCEKKTVVIKHDPEHRYKVVCPTDETHTLKIAKSMFASMLEEWRQGTRRGYGLDGMIFIKMLEVMSRKEQAKVESGEAVNNRWELQYDCSGALCRIGREWAPWYQATEEEIMTETRTLAIRDFNQGQLDIIRNQICKGASIEEIDYFLAVCNRTGYDPFKRQIYGIMRAPRKGEQPVLVIQVGIDGYRSDAGKARNYGGSDDAEFGPEDKDGHPQWARVKTFQYVNGQRLLWTVGMARWKEFCPPPGLDAMWQKMPYNQLAKCAEAQALRKTGLIKDDPDVVFSAEEAPVILPSGHTVNRSTGEIIEGQVREIASDANRAPTERTLRQEQLDYLLGHCTLHNADWKENKWARWTHPTDEKNPETKKTIWCYRDTRLNQIIVEELEAWTISTEQVTAYMEEHFGAGAKSRLTDDQRAQVILWIRADGEGRRLAEEMRAMQPEEVREPVEEEPLPAGIE